MATSTLPVSNLVNVSIDLSSPPAQAQSVNGMLILTDNVAIDLTTRMRTYSSLSQVSTELGGTSEAYYAAAAWFDQAPQPTQLMIGRWAKSAAAGQLICATLSAAQQLMTAWTAITAGSFKVAIGGGAATNVGSLNFSAQTNLNGVATVINTALTAATLAATCSWNSVFSRFEFISTATGSTASVSFLTAGTLNDISAQLAGTSTSSGAYVVPGAAAETAVSAVTTFDNMFGQQWYGLAIPAAIDSDHLAVAQFIEGSNTKHAYAVNTQEAGCLVSTDTTNIAYSLQQLNYKKTVTQFSSTSLYAVISLMARILTTNYNANNTVITLMYKTEPGVSAETLNQTQLNAVIGFNCNVFTNYNNNTAIIQNGVTASGDWIDLIFGADWLAITIQNSFFNALYSNSTKIPQTDEGNQILATAAEADLHQAALNGLLAPGTWTQAGFGVLNQGDYLPKGYYIYAPPISSQSPTDRAARKSVVFQIAAKQAGAIHTADVILTINR